MSEKKKKSPNRMNRWLFLALWSLSHIFAWVGTFGLADNIEPVGDWQLFLAFTFILGILPGALLSFPQKWLMKRGLGLDIQWWRRGSVIGWGLGGILLWGLVSPLSGEPAVPLVIGTWFGSFILAQYLLMRRYIHHASLYALANLASVIVFSQFVGLYNDVNLGRFIISGGLQGAVTGLTLLWLYGMIQQEKAKLIETQNDKVIERLSDKLDDEDYQLEDGTVSASKTSLY